MARNVIYRVSDVFVLDHQKIPIFACSPVYFTLVNFKKERNKMNKSKSKEYILEKRVDELESSIKNLLQYFTSGNEIEVQKATLTLNQIKSEFAHLFPDYKFTR